MTTYRDYCNSYPEDVFKKTRAQNLPYELGFHISPAV